MKLDNKKVVCHYGNFKYEGYIEFETDTHFVVYDTRTSDYIYLPKSGTVIKVK